MSGTNGQLSSPRTITCGPSQGSILDPPKICASSYAELC